MRRDAIVESWVKLFSAKIAFTKVACIAVNFVLVYSANGVLAVGWGECVKDME